MPVFLLDFIFTKEKQTFAQEMRYNACRFFILIIKGASNDTTQSKKNLFGKSA